MELLDVVQSRELTEEVIRFICRQLDSGTVLHVACALLYPVRRCCMRGVPHRWCCPCGHICCEDCCLLVVAAMTYMHSKHIAHCDLSLENVLITASNMNVRIIDFGLGAATDGLGHSAELFTRTGCGKPNYLAPEVRLGGSDGNERGCGNGTVARGRR